MRWLAMSQQRWGAFQIMRRTEHEWHQTCTQRELLVCYLRYHITVFCVSTLIFLAKFKVVDFLCQSESVKGNQYADEAVFRNLLRHE